MNRDREITPEDFENDVRRIARELWPQAEFSGATKHDGRERDGVFDTEDCRHVVEATTSREKAKAVKDIQKLVDLVNKFKRTSGTKVVRGWFITLHEPTADQRQVAQRHRDIINTLAFAQFQQRLVDSHAYLAARSKYAFGSVRDPDTGVFNASIEYVPLDLVRTDGGGLVSCAELVELVMGGRVTVLLGDYGAGKSMTLREIYQDLKKKHLKRETPTFPVFINLRDHYGQSEPAEVLHRHARSIGFDNPHHLVRAWRAGYVHLLLDGFDEITALNIQGSWRKLKPNRYRAMEGVRRLIREHRNSTNAPALEPRLRAGLLVAGRAHFFDSPNERRSALELPKTAIELTLNEFTEEQLAKYLETAGVPGLLPEWLPSRPLLVGYLAATHLLMDLKNDFGGKFDPVAGWEFLLDRVAARESEIEAGIDGATVRKILERLATRARASEGGLGPLRQESVIQAFRDICGYDPDDQGMVLLQRLPGLGVYRDEEESRMFIDDTFADACRAGDVVEFIACPFDFDSATLGSIESAMGSLGIGMAERRADQNGYSEGKVNTAIQYAERQGSPYMVADIARLMITGGFPIRNKLVVEGAMIPELELGGLDVDVSHLRFADCFFGRIEMEATTQATSRIPAFGGCFIESLEGRVSREDLPEGRFDKECVIDKFVTAADTTAGVLDLDLPLGTRVCLTVLKKIYERRGSGRKENALYRGMDDRARRLVPGVLQVLQSEKLVFRYRRKSETIWLAGRDRRRAGRLIAAPSASGDAAMKKCGELSG